MELSKVGQSIKQHRKSAGLTQEELARKIKKTESSIRKYEKGLVQIPIDVVEQIALALGTTPFELMGADYWDKKYPDIAKESAEYKGFIDYLHSLGYIVNQVYEACKIPIEEVSDELKDEANGQGFLEGETFHLELIKDGKNTTLGEEDFKQLQTETKDSIAFKLWQKSKDK